jgi:hypothetical protein
LDFGLANLTFTDNECIHSTKPHKQNDYKDLLAMIAKAYSNILSIPIFGYGAKTIPKVEELKASDMFPNSRDLRNPLIPNDIKIINKAYSECLK